MTSRFLCFPGTIWNYFKTVSLTLKYKYQGIQTKKTFPSFDFGIDHLSPSEPEERKQKKEQQQRFACIDVSKLDDLFEEAQARTTKYPRKYAMHFFTVIFAFNYYNKILKITFCLFLKKMCNKIKRELYATNSECFEIKFYKADRLPCFGCQMFKKMTI